MWAVAFERSTTNSSCQNKFYAWIDFKQVSGLASCLLYSTSDKHNTLKLQINSQFAHNFSFYLPFPLLLLYRKSSIVALTTNFAGFQWMIDRLQKQEQIGKATLQFTFHSTTTCKQCNNMSSKLKPTTLTFCSCKSFACPPDSFSCLFMMPSCPRPTVNQSRASIIETSTICRANTCTLSGASANAGPHYQKLYARVTHIWGNRNGQPNPSAM